MDEWSAAISAANGAIQAAEFAAGLAYQDYATTKQNEYNMDMWKLNNEYNSPQAQMQRFQEAGLNPNLIYSQGTPGNSSSIPQKNVPDQQHNIDKIGKAFNLVNLASAYENMRQSHYDAELKRTEATRQERILDAEYNFGQGWTYDYNLGKYVKRPPLGENEVRVVHPSAYYYNRLLENNYNKSALIPYRSALLDYQKKYLAPQITMSNYEAAHYPVSYWIGQGSRALQGVGSVVGMFNPRNWFMPLGAGRGSYLGPNGKLYNY